MSRNTVAKPILRKGSVRTSHFLGRVYGMVRYLTGAKGYPGSKKRSKF